MNFRFLLYSFLLVSISVSGQLALPDTISFEDSMLKSAGAGEYIIENRADSANTIVINEVLSRNSGGYLDEAGDDDDWFEIYNYGDLPVLLNDLWFTDDPSTPWKWQIKEENNVFINPQEYMLFWADDEPEEGFNHTSFKLSGDGEYLGVFNIQGIPIDECSFGAQEPNISYGRFPDGGLSWFYFDSPTPNTINATPGGVTFLPAPVSNVSGGFFSNPLLLELSTTVDGAEIVYTTDCSDPGNSSLVYTQPVSIASTTIIRARVLKEDAINSPILTLSFFFEADSFQNPVISLVADPIDLNGLGGLFTVTASDIEIPASLEYIVNKQTVFTSGMGVQLHSVKNTRPYSMRFYARSRYGNNWFEHPFFNENGPAQFKRLIARNSGNDNVNKSKDGTHFRDPLIHTIAKATNRNSMVSETQIVNIMLNGNYYGVFNLRERQDQFYIESRTGHNDNFDLLERAFDYPGNRNAIAGTWEKWDSLLVFVNETGDLTKEEDYKYLSEQVDIENFTDYWITEVFAGNFDWLSNNIKFWKAEDGKWQWIFWDLDHGLGLPFVNYGDVSWNTLKWSLSLGSRAGSSGQNNRLIRNLLKNESYKDIFITRFTSLLNTSFSPETTIPLFDSVKTMYEHDMVYHANRWGRSIPHWLNACSVTEDYLKNRPDQLFHHLQDFFNLDTSVNVTIKVDPPRSGLVSIEEQKLTSESFSGKYFSELEYMLAAEPLFGYVFTDWSFSGLTDDTISVQFTDSMEITAHFVIPDSVVLFQINELYFNNRSSYDCGDWIEFYYYGNSPIDISGYYITGNNDELLFTFGKGTLINSKEYFVVSEDISLFSKVFPEPIRCFDKIHSDLSEHNVIRLRTKSGEILREIEYTEGIDGWPELPNEGYSMELNSISSDSRSGLNWDLSENRHGSPGIHNYRLYNYHCPIGKDTTYNLQAPGVIPFQSSDELYYDEDGHLLAGIMVHSIEGNGVIKSGGMVVKGGDIYAPSDFEFFPFGAGGDTTVLNYILIDHSGEESQLNRIEFISLSNSAGINIIKELEAFPVPASDNFNIKLPHHFTASPLFHMLDMNGRIIKDVKYELSEDILKIDLSDTGNGLYFYMLHDESSHYSGKIVVIK